MILALALTIGTLASVMILGIPGTGSIPVLCFAILAYGSGAFLGVAAWFAANTLHGAPAVELRARGTRETAERGYRSRSSLRARTSSRQPSRSASVATTISSVGSQRRSESSASRG